MYEWLIVGGGVHATTIALQLRYLGLSTKELCIVDAHGELMAHFRTQTTRLSMPYLRSPLVHHCYPEPFDLKKFAKREQYTQAMIGHYQRPRLDMFFDHTAYWIEQYDLEQCHICQRAIDIYENDGHWCVTLDNGEVVQTRHVVLAMGTHETPYIPEIFKNQPDVEHIHQFDISDKMNVSHIVGSGISAAHLTLKLLSEKRNTPLHLWTKKELEVFDFDADPGWLGPKNMRAFHQEKDLAKRVEVNKAERHKGSMPKEMYTKLMRAVDQGDLVIHHTPIHEVVEHHIVTDDTSIHYDGVYLATGFVMDLMEQPLIQSIISQYDASMVSGYPVISEALEWIPNVFVSGMLADLELGPFARNIMGGRMAAQRIGEVYLQSQSTKEIAM
ncbi:FAD/NAD(P)-binding protein [Staphylococcus sp. 17KM0847]|uniref:FAD/NAD(P)-binding protein n=1 Tax=Staphylococcus sp. 17KM0847 TaxID=2583989 RepID=UPI0015DD1949|nr:FAD/NAD(P)-binding protein [Staphylococcus sp. 17KM0847]QLK86795.1 pyridine nucleotide-disulfide oxidoreductase [Staphylococcus sp. 17KM0847]